jgi:hypothetical protein
MNRALPVLLLIVSLLQFVTGEQALARTDGVVSQEGLCACVQNSARPQQKDEKTEKGVPAQQTPTLPPLPDLSIVGEGGESKPLSLSDAIKLTLENNKEVGLGRTGVRIAEIELSKVKKSAQGDAGRHTVAVAQQNLEAADAKFRQVAVEAITNVQYAYWDLVFASRDMQVKIALFLQGRELLRLNQFYFSGGQMDGQDVILVKIELSNREQALYDTKDTVIQSENALKYLMAVDKNDAMWNATLVPTDRDDNLAEAEISLSDALNAALQNHPDVLLQRTAEKINEIDQQYYKRQGEKGASYQKSLLEGERLKFERQRLELRVQVEVRNALQRLDNARKRLLAARSGRTQFEEIFAVERSKFVTGETSTREALASQSVLVSAQLLELRAENDYAKALAQLQRATGNSLQPAGK